MITEKLELKPCPSCGEKYDIHVVAASSWSFYCIMCWKCDYQDEKISPNKDAAIRHWNSIKRKSDTKNQLKDEVLYD